MHQFASPDDRKKYCAILLEKTENYITNTAGAHTEHMLLRSSEIIEAARKELSDLNKNGN